MFGDFRAIRRAEQQKRDAAYWRNAYETLVKQTGRDLNDGYGLDPRKPQPKDSKP